MDKWGAVIAVELGVIIYMLYTAGVQAQAAAAQVQASVNTAEQTPLGKLLTNLGG